MIIVTLINPVFKFKDHTANYGGRDSVVGIATRYRLDGPGIESQWGRDFPCRPERPRGPLNPIDTGFVAGLSGLSVVLTTDLLLVSGCELVGAIPPPPFCACIGMLWGNLYLHSH